MALTGKNILSVGRSAATINIGRLNYNLFPLHLQPSCPDGYILVEPLLGEEISLQQALVTPASKAGVPRLS